MGTISGKSFAILFLEHKLVIPDWNFYISEGNDILNTLHFYGLGDPIALFSVFVPTRYMHYFYNFASILRLYLAGIAFSALAFGTGIKNRYGILTGAVSYVFSFLGVMHVVRHPFFLNPFIYFPLVILGVEKIVRGERPYLLILAVAFSAASNFYFFYMIVLLTVVYTLIRLGFRYRRDLKNGVLTLLRIGGMSAVGVCVAGIIVLPIVMATLQDTRLSTTAQPFHLFYPLWYYSQFPAAILFNQGSYYTWIGLSVPVILAIFLLLFQKKKDRLLKALFLVCLLILLFPIGGRILNGMNYISNRWVWGFILLCSYILAKKWDALIRPSRSDYKVMLAGSLMYYAACLLFDQSRNAAVLSFIPLFFLSLLFVRDTDLVEKGMWKRQTLLLLVAVVNAVNIGYLLLAPSTTNWTGILVSNSEVTDKLKNNETGIVKELSDVPYPRYSGTSITTNANITDQISNTQFFWSFSNPSVNRFRSSMGLGNSWYYNYTGYEDRTSLLGLSAVQYYVTSTSNTLGMPYGYTLIDSSNAQETRQEEYLDMLRQKLGSSELTDAQSNKIRSSTNQWYFVYKNQYALPLGYCYSSYFTRDMWESLDMVQKQELQLESAYVDGSVDAVAQYTGQAPDYSIPYQLECLGSEITANESGFITTAANTTAVLSFEGTGNAETYLCLEGLEFTDTLEYDLYSDDETVDPLNLYNQINWELLSHSQRFNILKAKIASGFASDIDLTVESSAKVKKTLSYLQPDSYSSTGRHDYIINLGYIEEPVTSIRITFPKRGIYTIDNLRVCSIPMTGYAEKIGALQKNTLQNIQLGIDEIRGELTVDTPQLLCMAINYTSGWTAKVDGAETPVMVTNERYLGISVPAGSHKIEFHYRTPYKYGGFALSLAGMAALAAVVVVTENRRRGRKMFDTRKAK